MTVRAVAESTASAPSGPALFAAFAYPPNALGYCGPSGPDVLLEIGPDPDVAGEQELRHRAVQFLGAWPYLQLIAGWAGVDDPLDRRVVEAYWVGNRYLDRVPLAAMAASIEGRFRPRTAARRWPVLAGALTVGAVPHHNFHVLAVSPWVGLLKAGFDPDDALRVLDGCRIRPGTVVEVTGDVAVVRSRRLDWDGRVFRPLGEHLDVVPRAADGAGFVPDLRPGDRVAMHWSWICRRLTPAEDRALARYGSQVLQVVNRAAGSAGR